MRKKITRLLKRVDLEGRGKVEEGGYQANA